MTYRNSTRVLLFLLAMGGLFIIDSFIISQLLKIDDPNAASVEASMCKTNPESLDFGFDSEKFHIQNTELAPGQSLASLLKFYNVSNQATFKTIDNLKSRFDPTRLVAGNKMAFVSSDLCKRPDYLCYQINATKYLVCQLWGDHCVELVEKEKSYQQEISYGSIDKTLWQALSEENISLNLIDQMEDALSSSVDFYHVQKGDVFKLVFNRLYIDGQPTEDGELMAAYFNASGRENYSFKYNVGTASGYYDLEGRPMKSRFLKAPVRFSRITSGFNLKRLHPVLKYQRPHLGTDYAAPYGTPIMAVGAGVVEAAAYTGGNGNYVKIKHDRTYQTQYLHMSKFASGIRRGASVSQGQVIGFVGSTGLATGPHVCFRFWKDGRQVDHRRLSFPNPEPLPAALLPAFHKHKESLMTMLDEINEERMAQKRS